jgi:hypothetical protein
MVVYEVSEMATRRDEGYDIDMGREEKRREE